MTTSTTATTTTAPLREQAIAALDALEERQRIDTEDESERCIEKMQATTERATRHAVQVLGPATEGVRWAALDEHNAVAEIDGERLRFEDHYRRPGDLYHLIACPKCGEDSRAEVWSLERLAVLLRDQPATEYFCGGCANAASAKCEADRQARLVAEQAALDMLPPTPSAEVALRTAVKFANLARSASATHAYTDAMASAAISQAFTALAREISGVSE